MKITTLLLCMILLFPFFGPASVTASDHQSPGVINWYRADFPPVSIPRGNHADEGFFDRTMTFLIERLPQYENQFHVANFQRIMVEIKNKENVCCPSLYKTKDRENFVAFSTAAMVVLPNGIITSERSRNKLATHIDGDGKISLSSLLQDNNITIGISSGRIYSGGIDQILSQASGQKNLLVRSGDDVFRGLINMMHMGRIDCLIGYPVEAGYFVRENNKLNDFIYHPIKESTVPFTVGHIGCPNNEWGRNVISKVDEIVKKYRATEFIDFYGEWLDDSTRVVHRHMAEEHYKTLPQ